MLKKLSKIALAMSAVVALNTQAATEVVIVLDVSGSTGSLLPNWQARMQPEVFDLFLAADPNTKFGIASHVDFPFSPYGGSGEYGYRLEHPLTTNVGAVLTKLNALSSAGGGDAKESQLEAIYQAFTGIGLDLNNNGSYADTGDIAPQSMGWTIGGRNTKILIHFTSPLNYHNDPVLEVNYPYAGVLNHPATMNDINAIAGVFPAVYTLTPDPLPTFTFDLPTSVTSADKAARIEYMDLLQGYTEADKALSAKIEAENKANSPLRYVESSLTTAEKLARATGGDVLSVGYDLSGLSGAIDAVIAAEDDKNGKCALGEVLVETPFGSYCLKV